MTNPAWRSRLVAAAVALLPCLFAGTAGADQGCEGIFETGTTRTLTGKTVAGAKNRFSAAITLELTAGERSAGGVPIVAGMVRSERLKDGAVDWRSRPGSRWGNLCMDIVAPDGRKWSFLALTWEDDNAHPNLHGVIDWSAGNEAKFVGFVDTKDGAYHEAQAILEPGARIAARDVESRSGPEEPEAPASLCAALFGNDRGHFFVGRGYATAPGANPGHLAIHLSPGNRNGEAIALAGRYIATAGPKELERVSVTAENSACMDMPDPRYALLQLEDSRGGAIVLWLWGEDGIPQKDDRLMGYATFPGSAISRSKVAFWRL